MLFFDDIISVNDLDIENVLLNEKLQKTFFICDVSAYKEKTFHFVFDKIDGCCRKYDSTTYLGVFHPDERYEIIYDIIRHLTMLKVITITIKINSDDYLPEEKTYIHNVITLIQFVFNKNWNHNY